WMLARMSCFVLGALYFDLGVTVGAALRGRPSIEFHAGAATEGRPYSVSNRSKSSMRTRSVTLLFIALLLASTSFAQTPQRSPTDTMRDFYRLMREKKYREAFGISIYRPAIEG